MIFKDSHIMNYYGEIIEDNLRDVERGATFQIEEKEKIKRKVGEKGPKSKTVIKEIPIEKYNLADENVVNSIMEKVVETSMNERANFNGIHPDSVSPSKREAVKLVFDAVKEKEKKEKRKKEKEQEDFLDEIEKKIRVEEYLEEKQKYEEAIARGENPEEPEINLKLRGLKFNLGAPNDADKPEEKKGLESNEPIPEFKPEVRIPRNKPSEPIIEEINDEPGPSGVGNFEANENEPEGNLPPTGIPVVEEPDPQKGAGLNDNTGLWNYEMEKLMKKFKNKGFKGVYSLDMVNEIPVNKSEPEISFIMNTQPQSVKFGHWVAVYMNHDNLEYYDSYGEDPPKKFLKEIKKVADKYSPNKLLQLKINRIKYQRVNTNNCGFFAMKFLKDRYGGKNFKDATGFSIINKALKGEKEIEAFKKRVIEFGHI